VLVLDEPTNDLDIDTLELLEELLQDYAGTVFLVSHDRAFMDNVVTSIIACEASEEKPGFWREYEGSVQDWLTQSQRSQAIQAQSKAALSKSAQAAPKAAVAAAIAAPLQGAVGVKLSYKEQRELEGLPALIEALETEQKELRETLSDSQLFAADPGKATALFERDAQIEEDLLAALERWEVLSGA
jgi:ATP-binding cassette subfamily F protein uup